MTAKARIIHPLLLALLLLPMLCACSKKNAFSVEGSISDGATMNMRAIYYDGGRLQNSVFPTDKGNFAFEGSSADGTIVELLSNDYRVLGRFYAVDGDEIKVTLDPKSVNKIRIEGNEVSQRWAKVLNDNARLLDSRDSKGINAFIARYVGSHRSDIVSTLLMMTAYDWSVSPAEGEKLLSSISPGSRPARLVEGYEASLARVGRDAAQSRVVPFTYLDENDTIGVFNPRRSTIALLAFSDQNSGRSDSIVPTLKRIYSDAKAKGRLAAKSQPVLSDRTDSVAKGSKGLRILDFSMDGDTLSWRRGLRLDSAGFDHGWAAGSVAAPAVARLGIPRLPYFIVVDSTGAQVYRGPSLKAAEAALGKKMK